VRTAPPCEPFFDSIDPEQKHGVNIGSQRQIHKPDLAVWSVLQRAAQVFLIRERKDVHAHVVPL
jgi:hypothetical protein